MSTSRDAEDKRYLYLRGLFKHASSTQTANYREKEFIHLCRALARISLAGESLTSRHAVRQTVKGCGDKIEELLKEVDERGTVRATPPPRGTYCGAAEEGAIRLRKCAGCSAAHYCSEECQRGHWKAHKKTCRK